MRATAALVSAISWNARTSRIAMARNKKYESIRGSLSQSVSPGRKVDPSMAAPIPTTNSISQVLRELNSVVRGALAELGSDMIPPRERGRTTFLRYIVVAVPVVIGNRDASLPHYAVTHPGPRDPPVAHPLMPSAIRVTPSASTRRASRGPTSGTPLACHFHYRSDILTKGGRGSVANNPNAPIRDSA